jgi:hypothetical protein
MADNRIRSITGPSWSRIIEATGEPPVLTRAMSLMATVRVTTKRRPSTPAATTDETIARGTLRNGSLASSAKFAAESKPTSVVRPMIIPAIRPPPMAK